MLTSAKRRIELEQKHFPNGLAPNDIKLLDDVQELISRAYQSGRDSAEKQQPQEWNNQSYFGYMILAAEQIELGEHEINLLIKALHTIHDTISLQEAAEHYRCSSY